YTPNVPLVHVSLFVRVSVHQRVRRVEEDLAAVFRDAATVRSQEGGVREVVVGQVCCAFGRLAFRRAGHAAQPVGGQVISVDLAIPSAIVEAGDRRVGLEDDNGAAGREGHWRHVELFFGGRRKWRYVGYV